jgi:DNA invertase Pin-like site-specific DNA recombinase
MAQKLRCALYLRVSTLDQKTDLQREELESYCQARGWAIVATYEDKATGMNANRPEFQQAMKDAKAKKFDVLAVWKLDRYARSLADLLQNLQLLTDLGIAFVSMKDAGCDWTTPTGRLLTSLLSAFSEFEGSLIRMRVKAGLDAAKRKGKRLGRPKRRDDDQIRALRAQGKSIRQIAKAVGVSTTAVQRSLKGVIKTPSDSPEKAQ